MASGTQTVSRRWAASSATLQEIWNSSGGTVVSSLLRAISKWSFPSSRQSMRKRRSAPGTRTAASLVQVERARDGAARLEQMVESVEIGRDPGPGWPGLGQKLMLPPGQPFAQGLQWVRLGETR